MTLGVAVFILGCMWFYFKEPGFRKFVHVTLKVLAVLVVLSGLGMGGWYLKTQHDEKVQAAQDKAAEEKKAAKLAALCSDWEAKHPIGSPLDKVSDARLDDGRAVPSITLDPPSGCVGPLESAYSQMESESLKPEPGPWDKYRAHPEHHSTVWSTCDSDLTSESVEQGINTGHIEKGESAQLLVSNSFGAKIKTDRGEIGWVYPGNCITTKHPAD